MNVSSKIGIVLILCAAPLITSAQDSALIIPGEVREFVEKSETAIALESADLNSDGAADYILVTETAKVEPADENAEDKRTLLILVRDQAGKLKLVKRSREAVYCRSCGGVMGDPFVGVEARRGGFTVNNYGGSNLRWSESYQFNYSHRDRTWQLVRITEVTFNALEPKKVKTKILTPKNFGKIDIKDFDPTAIGNSK